MRAVVGTAAARSIAVERRKGGAAFDETARLDIIKTDTDTITIMRSIMEFFYAGVLTGTIGAGILVVIAIRNIIKNRK